MSDLDHALITLKLNIDSGKKPESIMDDNGQEAPVLYVQEVDAEYAVVAFTIPDGFYAAFDPASHTIHFFYPIREQ